MRGLPMTRDCPFCQNALIPIRVFGADRGAPQPVLHYADTDTPPGLPGSATIGVVQGARCPGCDQVFLFASPLQLGDRRAGAASRSRAPRSRTRPVSTELAPPEPELEELDHQALVERGLEAPWPERLRIIELLEDRGHPDAGSAVARLLKDALDDDLPTVARMAVQTAIRLGPPPELEPLLRECLRSSHDRLVVEALDALATHGSLASVQAIRDAGRGFFRAGMIKKAAQEALHQLVARHEAAPHGALSVAPDDPERGALSHVDIDAGLSLEEPDDEQP
jgi:hypothetical protein